MKPERVRELKVFAIIFVGFFVTLMLAFALLDYALRPVLFWLNHGTLIFPNFEIKHTLRIAGYSIGLSAFVAIVLVLEGKHSGRW